MFLIDMALYELALAGAILAWAFLSNRMHNARLAAAYAVARQRR